MGVEKEIIHHLEKAMRLFEEHKEEYEPTQDWLLVYLDEEERLNTCMAMRDSTLRNFIRRIFEERGALWTFSLVMETAIGQGSGDEVDYEEMD